MNYTEEKTRIENEIKALTEKLENLKKQEEKEKKKEEWKKSLVEKFKEFLESTDFTEVEAVEIKATTKNPAFSTVEAYFYNEPESTAKVETEPTAEPKTEEKNENQIKVGDYVFYRNIGETGEVVSIIDGLINIKTKENKIRIARPEWIYKVEKPAEKPENKIIIAGTPKPEEKPVKMKMTLDEFIDSLPEPAQK